MESELIKYAHTLSEKEFNKKYPNKIHAWALRDNFEEPIRQYNFKKADKPKLANLLEKYIYLHNHSLPENRAYLTIGFCYALKAKEGNFTDGAYLYPEIDRNINCNWGFDRIIAEVSIKLTME